MGIPRSDGGSSEESVDLGTLGRRETGRSLNGENQLSDCAPFISRCSVRMVNEVVSKFDPVKCSLVKDIGFEGILHFPPLRQINRRFSLWLMNSVDERRGNINIGGHTCLTFDKFDVAHVFGIPAVGKLVLDTSVSSREARDRVIELYLGTDFKEQRSIKKVQEIVEREYPQPMVKEDCDRFKVAFVVFVVSNLLSPSAKYDYAAVDYWNAIRDPNEIVNYDWSGFVLTKLLDAVAKVKQDISNNMKFPNLTGCSIFLQVLYLDSLDLGPLSLPHNLLPRSRAFSFDTIRTMMLADINFRRHTSGDDSLPAGKLRDVSRCIYSWAVEATRSCGDSRSGCLLAIWESAVAFVKLLNIPFEAAGPLFVAIVDFQEQINSGVLVCGTQALKFLSLLVSLIMPFTKGFRYKSSYGMEDSSDGDDLVGSAVYNGMRVLSMPIRKRFKTSGNVVGCSDSHVSLAEECEALIRPCNGLRLPKCPLAVKLDSSAESSVANGVLRSLKRSFDCIEQLPDSQNTDIRVATTMARFYSVFRKLKSVDDFDLNSSRYGDNVEPGSSSTSRGLVDGDLPSPWELGYSWSVSDVSTVEVMSKFSALEHDERLAIVHLSPKFIQVKWDDLVMQLKGLYEMELDLFDALIRVAKQEDDYLYGSDGGMRWRHFIESDFMGAILDGKVDVLDPKLRDHLRLSGVVYDLSRSKMVVFPGLVQCQWVCFVWLPDSNIITCFDPSHAGRVPECRSKVIERAGFMLKLALKNLSDSVFIGAPCDVAYADLHIMNIADAVVCRVNCSGICCSFFYRCFDGRQLRTAIGKYVQEDVAAKLFVEIGKLKRNIAEFDKSRGEDMVGG